MDLLAAGGGGGGRGAPSPDQRVCKGVLFFMIKQKILETK